MRLFAAETVRGNPEPDPDHALHETVGRGSMEVDGNAGETYYLAVVSEERGSQIPYRLETRTLVSPDARSGPDGEPAGAKRLAVNGSSTGRVDYDAGDRTDWWQISPAGPGMLTVTLFGRNTSDGIRMALYDRAGIEKLSEGQPAGNGREEMTVDLSRKDTFLIRVFADDEGNAGDYQLVSWYSAGTGDTDDRGGSTDETPDLLHLRRPAKGVIDYSAGKRANWWKITAENAGTLTVDMEGDAANNLDMAVYESNDRETPLATSHSRNSNRERVSVEVDRSGWYYVEIYAQKPGEKSRYTVTATFER
ncbi:MAG: PPC domain-containing protein [candidate division Zixibacteria bacterium]|nr:PPC domain-containing protein [candidate division Zixibacteria bacterium]